MSSQVTFKGNAVHLAGSLPNKGEKAPNFYAIDKDLGTSRLSDYEGGKVILNIFPSVDTGVCAASVREFHKLTSKVSGVTVLCISKDLPFAQARFCAAEGIDNVVMLSDFRGDFEKNYPICFTDGPLEGLLSRAVVLLDENGKIIYTEQVAETTEEPNYQAVLDLL